MSDDNIVTSERVGYASRTLIDAVNRGDVEDVRKVLSGSKTYVEGKIGGRTALSYATASADITENNEYGRSPLSYASEAGYFWVILILINNGVVVDDKDSNGRIALSYAAQRGFSEILSILLEAGASPNGTIVWNES
uniref:Uncharacterized protein n=1 Tax=Globisporangium ultimum (strain ATCC 200006 / CBS 805.95 / DAOM BR144) TaxID=431595 RepID=K3WKT5_GLOUD